MKRQSHSIASKPSNLTAGQRQTVEVRNVVDGQQVGTLNFFLDVPLNQTVNHSFTH